MIRSVLVVCSGNTCRSPLAAAMLRAALAERPAPGEVRVGSAGTGAWDGAPASEGSYLVALERGLDLSTHRARMLTTQLVREADLILTMTTAHSHRVIDMGGAGKTHTLAAWAGEDGGDIPDPFGGDVERYRAVADQMAPLIAAVVHRLREPPR
ncbi:MAG TPA: low molecular weight protein arginine phosphatase [Gemmatimonadales bacterium]|nr:low molecular weight protein arginine phosphatase [Gemmatimonadales bacterium]